jgi:hypothetical protein
MITLLQPWHRRAFTETFGTVGIDYQVLTSTIYFTTMA